MSDPTVYLALPDIAAVLARPLEWVKNMRRSGALLEPDVMVGARPECTKFPASPGWALERVVAYGKVVNVLGPDGQPLPLNPWLPPPAGMVFPWWYTQRVSYLSSKDLALVWGQKQRTVAIRLQRAQSRGYDMPPAAVCVGDPATRWRRMGWDWDTVADWSRKRGKPMAATWEQADLAQERDISLEEAAALLNDTPEP